MLNVFTQIMVILLQTNFYINKLIIMFKEECESKYEWNHPLPTFLSNQSSLTNSTCFTSPTLWQSSLPPSNHTLKQYRKNKPNQNIQFHHKQQEFMSKFLCKIFSFSDQQQTTKTIIPYRCQCERTEDYMCPLVIKWIQEHYYWKTDKQFVKVYQHYNRKKSSQCLQELTVKLQNIVSILGVKINPTQLQTLAKIIANYVKHTVYYSRSQKLIKESELYLWVSIGILYHIGIMDVGKHQQVIFWSIDIAMNSFEDLSSQSMIIHSENVMKYLGYYFPKWVNFLVNEKNINLKQIVKEWLSEMMFGYMGIQSIAFFIDCFIKMKWKYIYKVILSFFEHRTDALGKNELFLTGTAKKEDIIRILVDGKEEWPMIFCSTITFNFEDKQVKN